MKKPASKRSVDYSQRFGGINNVTLRKSPFLWLCFRTMTAKNIKSKYKNRWNTVTVPPESIFHTAFSPYNFLRKQQISIL